MTTNFKLDGLIVTKLSGKLTNRLLTQAQTAAKNYADTLNANTAQADQEIPGIKTFINGSATVMSATPGSTEITNKGYVDDKVSKASSGIFGGELIGYQGKVGFGQGVCPFSNIQLALYGLTPAEGYDDPTSENYGHYIHDSGSVFIWLPKCYYRIANKKAITYSVYGGNTIEIADKSVFATTAEAEAAGFALFRADINGGIEQEGEFIAAYMASRNTGSTGITHVKNADPLNLYTSGSQMTKGIVCTPYGESASYTCVGQYIDSIELCRALGKGCCLSNIFLTAKISILTLAHAQLATGTEGCAWYDASGVANFPKGNNNSGRDVNDTSITFTSATSYGTRTGSASPLAKTTHNGQACGITDVNGNMWETQLGITTINSNGGANLWVLREDARFQDLTSGQDTEKGAFYTTDANFTNSGKYDKYTSLTAKYTVNGAWGNATYPSISSDAKSGLDRALAGVYPLVNSTGGTNLFGSDNNYGYHNGSNHTNALRGLMFLPAFGSWYHGAASGVFARASSSARTGSDPNGGFRAAIYLDEVLASS